MLSWWNFGPLISTTFLQFIEVFDCFTALLRAGTWPWVFYSSDVLSETSWCVSGHFTVVWPRFSQALTVRQMTSAIQRRFRDCKLPRCSNCETTQIMTLPPPCLTVGVRCFCWTASVSFIFAKHGSGHKEMHFFFPSSFWKSLLQKCCGVFRWSFANLTCASMFFWVRRGFLLPKRPHKPLLSSNAVMGSNFNHQNKTCRVRDGAEELYLLHQLWRVHLLSPVQHGPWSPPMIQDHSDQPLPLLRFSS